MPKLHKPGHLTMCVSRHDRQHHHKPNFISGLAVELHAELGWLHVGSRAGGRCRHQLLCINPSVFRNYIATKPSSDFSQRGVVVPGGKKTIVEKEIREHRCWYNFK